MTDKEKIELIIQDKHLNSTQFCNAVCIAPGTLSHIRSGRTEPTLNTLRSVAQAFPDINPAWLFYGEGDMYKKTDSPTLPQGDGDDAYINNVENEIAPHEDSMPLFAFSGKNEPSHRTGTMDTGVASGSTPSAGGASRRSMMANVSPSSLNVQEIVAETLKQQQKPQRKVVEVRIFFDDGTFETFSAK